MSAILWYFNSGNIPVPVRLPGGNTVSVPVRGHVPTSAKLAAKVPALRQTGAPQDAKAIAESMGVDLPVVLPKLKKTHMAAQVTEGPAAIAEAKPLRKLRGSKGEEPPAE